jgi:hypothetical protein
MPSAEEQARQLAERLAGDPAFRAEFRRDPVAAARGAGWTGLAETLLAAGGDPLRTLDVRESRSSLAGVAMAAAVESIGLASPDHVGGHRHGSVGARDLLEHRARARARPERVDPSDYGVAGSGGRPSPETAALLHNPHVAFDADGVADLRAGRIDPRIVSVLTGLSRHHRLTISAMSSDHSKAVAGGGSVSNHYYGRAVDIAAIDGVPIGPGNALARRIAEGLMRLSPRIRPTEIGSPWALPGAAYFTDAAHQNHLHIAYDDPIAGGWQPPHEPAADAPAFVAVDEDDRGEHDDDDGDDGDERAEDDAREDGGSGDTEEEADDDDDEDDDDEDEDEDDDEDDDDEDDDDDDEDEDGEDEDEDGEDDEDEDEDEEDEDEEDEDEEDEDEDDDGDEDEDDEDDDGDEDEDDDDGDEDDDDDGDQDDQDQGDDHEDQGDPDDHDPAPAASRGGWQDPGIEAGPYPGDGVGKARVAAWMAERARARGIPPELPVMASLVESGLSNLSGGDADSVGFFQMRAGIWNRGAYAGYGDHPELQLKWFLDQAAAVKRQRLARGLPVDDPRQYGEWIADIERPAAQYRGRYQLRLDEARALLEHAAEHRGHAAGGGARRADVLRLPIIDPETARRARDRG